ncbi:MAG TPA: hypothetical protein VMW34_09950 [Anaerolineales bacterium]|jgi:uncharacterized protein with GYD domain|nr:hypothetical protein [Anaerolineales bacterium]
MKQFTDEGAKTLKTNPARLKEVNQELETMLRVAVDLGARGSVRLLTMPAFSIDEFISMIA